MQETFIEDLGTVLKNRSRLEKSLKLKITNQGKNVFLDGSPEDEYIGVKVLEAIDLGFSLERALLLKDPEILLQILNIREVSKKDDTERIKARIIGTHGKTISNLYTLTDCYIAVKDNKVGIIGDISTIDEAIIGLKCIIQGSKQANVYARLERKKKERRLSPPDKIVNEFKKDKIRNN